MSPLQACYCWVAAIYLICLPILSGNRQTCVVDTVWGHMVAVRKAHLAANRLRQLPYIAAGLSALIIMGVSHPTAYADTARQKLVISPVAKDITLNPGQTYSDTMTAVNQSPGVMNLSLYASPYFVSGEQYKPIFSDVDPAVRADTWVKVSPRMVSLAAQGVVTADYTVTVPNNARPGGYYAVVFAQAAGAATGSVGVSERAGEILYITVNGPASTSGAVDFTPVAGLTFNQTISPRVRIHDTGSVHFTAQVDQQLQAIISGNTGTVRQSVHVLPGTTRMVSAPVTLQPYAGIGIYKLTRTVTFLNEPAHTDTQLIVFVSPAWPALLLASLVVGILIRLSHGKRARDKHV